MCSLFTVLQMVSFNCVKFYNGFLWQRRNPKLLTTSYKALFDQSLIAFPPAPCLPASWSSLHPCGMPSCSPPQDLWPCCAPPSTSFPQTFIWLVLSQYWGLETNTTALASLPWPLFPENDQSQFLLFCHRRRWMNSNSNFLEKCILSSFFFFFFLPLFNHKPDRIC